jgi:hypothetical protein
MQIVAYQLLHQTLVVIIIINLVMENCILQAQTDQEQHIVKSTQQHETIMELTGIQVILDHQHKDKQLILLMY